MIDDDKAHRLSEKTRELKAAGFYRLKATLSKFPHGAKIALHSRGIDELIEIAAKYERAVLELPYGATENERKSLASDIVIRHDFAHGNLVRLAATAMAYVADPIGHAAAVANQAFDVGLQRLRTKLRGRGPAGPSSKPSSI